MTSTPARAQKEFPADPLLSLAALARDVADILSALSVQTSVDRLQLQLAKMRRGTVWATTVVTIMPVGRVSRSRQPGMSTTPRDSALRFLDSRAMRSEAGSDLPVCACGVLLDERGAKRSSASGRVTGFKGMGRVRLGAGFLWEAARSLVNHGVVISADGRGGTRGSPSRTTA